MTAKQNQYLNSHALFSEDESIFLTMFLSDLVLVLKYSIDIYYINSS